MSTISAFMNGVTRLNDGVGRMVAYLIVPIFAFLILEVFLRYLFNAPTVWTNELTQMLFGAYAVLSGGYILAHRGHVNVDLFHARFGPRMRAVIDIIGSLIFFIFVLAILFFGYQMAQESVSSWETSYSAKFKALRSVVLPIMLVVMVMGSIIGGLTTPTEAAAMGVLGALVSAAVYRQLNMNMIREAAIRTFKLTGMIVWILFAAHAFSSAYQSMGAHQFIESLILLIPGGPWGIISAMMLIVFVLGMVLDPVGIMLITLPVSHTLRGGADCRHDHPDGVPADRDVFAESLVQVVAFR